MLCRRSCARRRVSIISPRQHQVDTFCGAIEAVLLHRFKAGNSTCLRVIHGPSSKPLNRGASGGRGRAAPQVGTSDVARLRLRYLCSSISARCSSRLATGRRQPARRSFTSAHDARNAASFIDLLDHLEVSAFGSVRPPTSGSRCRHPARALAEPPTPPLQARHRGRFAPLPRALL